MLSIEFSNHAKRFLKRSDKKLAARIVERIDKLAADPFPSDAKRVVNRKEKVFRIRIGDCSV